MGSDKSYKYSGTMPKSQHYAKAYHVTPEMIEYDKQRGVYNGIYELNPTAQNITKNGNSEFVISKNANDWYTYVVKLNGDIIVGKRNGNGRGGKATPHPTLVGGTDPLVQVAGMLLLKKGKILKFNHESGHFKPNIKSMKAAKEAFSKLPATIFHKEYKGE
ncbi:MAG: hypothetical protein J6Z08_06680 [Elusimicrobiales bacterium]|nr:hypothetical protein [Elusimicrobiales bacterium]